MWVKSVGVLSIGLGLLSACGDREEILQGERLGLRDGYDTQAVVQMVDAPGFAAPAPRVNASWTHRNGTASHSISHPSLSSNPQRIWTASIGAGDKRGQRIASDPVVAAGAIYTLDSNFNVRATSTSGGLLWETNVDSLVQSRRGGKFESSGGGVAYDAGNLAVSTAKGEVLLLDARTGAIQWRHREEAVFASAPAIRGNRVVAVSRDNKAYALNVSNGRIAWQQLSGATGTGILGTGTPAIEGNEAMIAYSSGEVVATNLTTGLSNWSQTISGRRIGVAKSDIAAVSGDPVVTASRVYAGTHSGRMIAVDRTTGERLWTIKEGAIGPVWPAGNSIFVLTDELKVKRLNAADGAQVWATDLPMYKNEKKKRGSYGYYGPVLAGGRVYVSGSDGVIRAFNPTTGALVNSIAVSGGLSSQPVVAGGRMYVLSSNGQLIAFQ